VGSSPKRDRQAGVLGQQRQAAERPPRKPQEGLKNDMGSCLGMGLRVWFSSGVLAQHAQSPGFIPRTNKEGKEGVGD
jgi:hypothetical protein